MDVFKMGIATSFVGARGLHLSRFLFLFLLIGILTACNNGGGSDLPPSAPDTTPPTVSFNPTPGQGDVFITSAITIQFSEPVSNLVPSNFGICEVVGGNPDCINNSISFGFEIDTANNLVTLQPTNPTPNFVGDKIYEIKTNINGTITDTSPAQNPLGGGSVVTARFSTSSRPSVTATLPGNPGPRSTISATFSEAMKPATISDTSFTVKDSLGMAIAGTVSLSGDGLTASFLPAVDLVTGAPYTATMSTGATDLADNALVEHIWNVTLQAPTAIIHFPTPVSLTDATTLTVTGAASDEGNIMGVSVNGVQATSTDGFATWRAEQVGIVTGETRLVVRTEDVVGNVDTLAAEARVNNSGPILIGPYGITLDATNNRALIVDDSLDALVAVDLATGNRTIISNDSTGNGSIFSEPLGITLDVSNNRALVIDASLRALVAVDLATGNRTIVSDASTGNGETLSRPEGLTLDDANNRALVIDKFPSFDRLIAVDLATGNRTRVSGAGTGNGPAFSSLNGVTLDATNNRVLVADRGQTALVAVDLATRNRTIVSDINTGNGPAFRFPQGITIQAANNRALVTDQSLRALVAVDLATGNRTIVSDASTGSGPTLINPYAITLDASNNRAIITDSGAQVAVDLATGNRTIVSVASTGSGLAFNLPNAVTPDAANNRALVIDGNLLALVAVDLATGNRTILSDTGIGNGPVFIWPIGLTMDTRNNRVFVIDFSLRALVAVDLATGNRTIVSDGNTGGGPIFSLPNAVTMDANNNRALVIDFDLLALMAVDLATGDRTIVSDASTGAGPAFSFPQGVALDAVNNRALVMDNNLLALVAVDLTTGDRTIFSGASVGGGPALGNLRSITLDATNNRAIVVDSGVLVAVDLATGNRKIVSSAVIGNGTALIGPSAVTLDANFNRVLVADGSLGALVAVELGSGDRVFVSK